MYDAIDTDLQGYLFSGDVETFFRDTLRGKVRHADEIDTNFEDEHHATFALLENCENGEVDILDLQKFLRFLLQNQVIFLRQRMEKQQYERSMDEQRKQKNAIKFEITRADIAKE